MRLPIALLALALVTVPADARDQTGSTKEAHYGTWSRGNFADSVGVSGQGKLVFFSGMGSEDGDTGDILFPGDSYKQCQYAYQKIRAALAAQGGQLSDVIKITTYLTDIRGRVDYIKCRKEVFTQYAPGAPPPAHTFLNISQLAWPGMMVEVDVTAFIPADRAAARVIVAPPLTGVKR